jgi:hypothetical protein
MVIQVRAAPTVLGNRSRRHSRRDVGAPGHEYSSKVQQRRRYSALSSGVHPHSARLNDAERGPCRHFASKGLGVRVPLAPLFTLVRGTSASRRKRSWDPSTAAKYSNGAAGGDAQWPSRRSPSAFNALKVESLVTYTSIVTAIWLWRSICMATRGWTSRATSKDAQALRVACTVVVGTPARLHRGTAVGEMIAAPNHHSGPAARRRTGLAGTGSPAFRMHSASGPALAG